jgi:LamB porin
VTSKRAKCVLLLAALGPLAPTLALAQDDAPPPPPPAAPIAPPAPPAPAPPPAPVPLREPLVTTEPQAEATPSPVAPVNPPPPKNGDTGRFEFGSYGRVVAASDLRGGTGRDANIIAHGDRIDEDSYAELELRREDTFSPDVQSRIVSTLALFPPFFHFSGDATQAIAVRNLYAQGTYKNYTMWVGSRMYRGDDIYLLDWWPLDNQNTVGGGVGGAWGDTRVAAHVGMNRLDNIYQSEQIPVPAPYGFGAVNVQYLDRPRIVETLKATQLFPNLSGSKRGFKVVLYGELHEISAGTYRNLVDNQDVPYPADTGFLAGTELAYWTGEHDTFVQLFMRYARGIAAYDPLSVPQSFANDRTTSGSTETLIAVGGNYETDTFGVLYGAYLRFFRDGDPSQTSIDKYDEGIAAVRPAVFLGDYFGLALEGSYQERRYAFLNGAGTGPLTASLWRFGVIPYFSPSGKGSYKRPQLRILYNLTARDSGARSLYPSQDVFAQRSVEHFLGVGAEWWFNSSSYP